MSEEDPQACAEPEEPKAGPPPEKTSDYYRVSEDLPARFNNPAWFRGYRTKEPLSVYRTSNQAYGSRAPTVHEMPHTLKETIPPGAVMVDACRSSFLCYNPECTARKVGPSVWC
ncbi:piercer of microtubule wall 1 protein isoform 4-T5 [Dama dama]|uniref:piercer of microtubule wall 1 protein isoform X4 n=1 Tax=Dama dama TaxID=30532 RepID=UPI002A3715B4|nr:piercer of microtubule wall 1 protein isoform X4 [Dama dama]